MMMILMRAASGSRLSAAPPCMALRPRVVSKKISSALKQQKYSYGSMAAADSHHHHEGDQVELQALAEKIKRLPERVNWVEEGVVGPVVDQGYTNSCWAYQTVDCLNSVFQLATGGKPHRFSVKELLDFDAGREPSLAKAVFKMWIGLHKENQGGLPATALQWVSRYGLSFENDYPRIINPRKKIMPKIDAVGEVPPYHEDYLKLAVASHPVIVGLGYLRCSFAKYKEGIYRENRKPDDHPNFGKHSVLVVGYDIIDDDDGKQQPVWLVKNSFGRYWGMKGYMYLPRDVDQDTPWVNCYLARRPVYPILNSFNKHLDFSSTILP